MPAEHCLLTWRRWQQRHPASHQVGSNFSALSLHSTIFDLVVKLPKQSRSLDIRTEGLYRVLLLYARSVWPNKKIVSDGGAQEGTILSSKVKAFGNVLVRGVKYGMFRHHRGKGYCYAFINGRIPCQIEYLVQISLSTGEESLVALVRRFEGPDEADEDWRTGEKALPWHDWCVLIMSFSLYLSWLTSLFRATDLGTSIWIISQGNLEAVAMEDLSGRFAWGQLALSFDAVLVVFSLDHVRRRLVASNHMDLTYN